MEATPHIYAKLQTLWWTDASWVLGDARWTYITDVAQKIENHYENDQKFGCAEIGRPSAWFADVYWRKQGNSRWH